MTDDEKLKELFQEHPYLLSDQFLMTRTEAEKIYEKGFPNAKEIIDGAKEKSAVDEEAWKPFYDALKENK